MSMLREEQLLILAAGMPRSGSTWLYNAVRLLLLQNPAIAGDLGCGWISDWNTIPKRKYLLVKIHNYDVGAVVLSKLVIYSYRDVRDAIASQKRRFGGTPDMLWADLYIHHHELWMRQAAYAMKYETLLEDQDAVLADIQRTLATRCPQQATRVDQPRLDEVAQKLRRLTDSPGVGASGGYDRVTLYHPAHITDGRPGSWRGWIGEDLAERITGKYRWWFDKYGYETETPGNHGGH